MPDGNKNFKQFKINTLDDALIVMNSLVASCILNLDKFEIYVKQSIELQDKYMESSTIPGNEYEDISDKVLFRQRQLIEYMADEANDIFSYKSLRKKLLKRGFINEELDQSIALILNEFHIVRNWTFHNVQSHLVAERERAEKAIPSYLKDIIKVEPQHNPLIVVTYKEYTKEMLDSFVLHNKSYYVKFKMILDYMKKDYQEMYDHVKNPKIVSTYGTQKLVEDCNSVCPVRYVYKNEIMDVTGRFADVSNISMAIQKGKYDGSMEAFDKYTVTKKKIE